MHEQLPSKVGARSNLVELRQLRLLLMAISSHSSCDLVCSQNVEEMVEAYLANSPGGKAGKRYSREPEALGLAISLHTIQLMSSMSQMPPRDASDPSGPDATGHAGMGDLLLVIALSPHWQNFARLELPVFPLLAKLLHGILGRPGRLGRCGNRTHHDHHRSHARQHPELAKLLQHQWGYLDTEESIDMTVVEMAHRWRRNPPLPQDLVQDFCLVMAYASELVLYASLVGESEALTLAASAMASALLLGSRDFAAEEFFQSPWPLWRLLGTFGWDKLLGMGGAATKRFFRWISPLLPEKPVIFEAGSYDGQHTKVMAEFWPQGEVHVMEADPRQCPKVRRVAASFANIFFRCAGLARRSGTANFILDDQGTLYPELNRWKDSKTVKIPVRSLTTWV